MSRYWLGPAPQLALDVPLVSAEVPQADRVDVDGVQAGQRVGHVVADRGARAASSKAASALGASRRMWPSTNSMT